MARADFQFSTRVRVRYAEIDAQAVVFNSRYLEYADVAVTEYWRTSGLSARPEWKMMEFHVARALIEYKAPIRYDEELDLYARTTRIGKSSLTTLIEIHGAAVLAHHQTGIALTDNCHFGSSEPAQIRVGPVFSEFSAAHPFDNGRFATTVRLSPGSRRIETCACPCPAQTICATCQGLSAAVSGASRSRWNCLGHWCWTTCRRWDQRRCFMSALRRHWLSCPNRRG